LINIFIVVFVDLLGFSLILPLLPYYAAKFGASPFVIGLLTASYAAASLVGAPLMGRFSDRFGRRLILLISVAGTFLGFLLLAVAEPIAHSLASRIVKLHGGSLKVASRLGERHGGSLKVASRLGERQGTVFSIYLPVGRAGGNFPSDVTKL
jgi:DHA1 family tetracycline resistance protein-like MFS transporter